jgi:signal recognition particle receptor subunit beta
MTLTKTNNYRKLIQIKLVFWGPGESGKTTNYHRLKEKYHSKVLNKGYSIETTDGRTLWQDALYLSFDFNIENLAFNIVAQIITCTGQERFLSTREYVLEGADGIVFVGDSDPEKSEQNKRSFRELLSFTSQNGVPYVVQLNKRDLDDAVSIDEFKKQLGLPIIDRYADDTFVVYPVIALEGKNVVECFLDLVILVIYNYFRV